MFAPNGWFAVVRGILELAYFASGIVIAVAAVLALGQIKLTKQIAKSNARRESVKLASDLCRYYAETVIPSWEAANNEYKGLKLKFLAVSPPQGKPAFVIKDGEIVDHHFDLTALAQEFSKAPTTVHHLNTLESFAIPFAEGVADENIGYRETARAFCQEAQLYMPAIFQLRKQNSGRFESVVKLYAMWTSRLAAETLAPLVKVIQQLEKAAAVRIKPLD